MIKIIVLGTGNIGKRHIQAISKLNHEFKLFCFDIFERSLDSTKQFVKDNNLRIDDISFETNFQKIINIIDEDSFVIISTTANGRKDVLTKIIEKNPKAIICEKPVTQKRDDYEKIIELNKTAKIKIYINYARRAFPGYIKLFNKGTENLRYININLPKIGVGCNGVHYFDLANWFLGEPIGIVYSEITEKYKSKRSGFEDFSGFVTIKYTDNKYCNFSMNSETELHSIEFKYKDSTKFIFESKDLIYTFKNNENTTKENFKTRFCSEITNLVIDDIINNKKPFLTTIEDAYIAHRLLYDILEGHGMTDLNYT